MTTGDKLAMWMIGGFVLGYALGWVGVMILQCREYKAKEKQLRDRYK